MNINASIIDQRITGIVKDSAQCFPLGRFEFNQGACHANAVEYVFDALRSCYGDRVISLQQLSATFRRGDLLEMLGIDGDGSEV